MVKKIAKMTDSMKRIYGILNTQFGFHSRRFGLVPVRLNSRAGYEEPVSLVLAFEKIKIDRPDVVSLTINKMIVFLSLA